ncbi:2-amino-4-hydroxy-6-hydroxymethyldihydropteridine diphosphokinase [Candidatus Margulisiibacteriota bacterium]
MTEIFLGLGANLGDRQQNITNAVKLLEKHEDIKIEKISSLIQTKFSGGSDKQPDYLNGALKIQSDLSPQELLAYLEGIERAMGRIGKTNWLPRPIDIDILFYGHEVICEDDLTIPHPLLHERDFVIIPLLEIAPDFVHPIFNETIESLYAELT